MRLRLTMVWNTGGDGEQCVDLDVHAEPGHTVGDLWPAAQAALGWSPTPESPPLYAAGLALTPDAQLGWPPLLDGAVVHVGGWAEATSAAPAVVELHVVSGPDCGQVVALPLGTTVVGRAASADLRIEDNLLSRWHARITVTTSGVRITDLRSSNGTRVNGFKAGANGRELQVGIPVLLGRTEMAIRQVPQSLSSASPDGRGHLVVRPGGPMPATRSPARVRLPAPLAPHRPNRLSLLLLILPVGLAAAIAVVARNPAYLLMGLTGPVMMLGAYVSDRRHQQRVTRAARAAHAAETVAAHAALAIAVQEEGRDRFERHPDAAAVLRAAMSHAGRLWERRAEHPDFGVVRLGVGDLSAEAALVEPDGEERHPRLRAPLTCRLAAGSLISISGPRSGREALARSVIGQLTTLHPPGDVIISVRSQDPVRWRWVELLPHWCPPNQPGNNGPDAALVVVLHDEPVATSPQGAAHAAGTCVLRLTAVGDEPADADQRIRVDADGALDVHTPVVHARGTADLVATAWAQRVADALVALREQAGPATGRLSETVRLLDLLDVDASSAAALAAGWERQPSSTRAVLGHTGVAAFAVDLSRDGPHALVAGTTGAGKSELLQTFVAGLAVVNRPDELSFVLVDYKGGAAFRECAQLPHTVGLVTDLDGPLTGRALTSLRAELTRRERLFHRAGVSDLPGYRERRSGLPKLARLVIVVDEFRMLAEELPDFVRGLVSVATLGRSLGIHLVLATQRPSGVISADIKANVNLRVALRVRDDSESLDVIDDRSASSISHLSPGRAYVRCGESAPVLIQAARVTGLRALGGGGRIRVSRRASDTGGRTDGDVIPEPGSATDAVGPGHAPDVDRSPGSMAQMTGLDGSAVTDLAVVVAALQQATATLDIAPVASPWLPPLPDRVLARDLQRAGPGEVRLGLLDLPQRQQQVPWLLDGRRAEHVALVGGPRSGRTAALRTVAAGLAADEAAGVATYLVEGVPGGLRPLTRLRGVASVVGGDEPMRLVRLVSRLAEEVDRRRAELADSGGEDDRLGRTGTEPWPWLWLLVDGWDTVIGVLEETSDRGRAADDLRTVLRDGLAVGVRCVATGGRALLSSRITPLFAERVVLPTSDPADAVAAGVKPSEIPNHWPPGRGIRLSDRATVQLALVDTEDLAAVTEQGEGRKRRPSWPFVTVEPLPRTVDAEGLQWSAHRDLGLVGVGGDAARPVGLPVGPDARASLILGPSRSGRTTCLAMIAASVAAAGRSVAVVNARSAPLTELTGGLIRMVVTDVELRRMVVDHPDACLVVDDAAAVEDTPLGDALLQMVRAERVGATVVCATALHELAGRYRGLVVEVARHRRGVLLNPVRPSDGDPFGIRAPGVDLLVPGRGYLVSGNETVALQVARPGRRRAAAA